MSASIGSQGENSRFEKAILAALARSSQTRCALHSSLNAFGREADEVIGRALARLKRRGKIRCDGSVWRLVEAP